MYISFAAPSRNGNETQSPMATQTATGWKYTVSGLDAGTEYTYTVIASDGSNTLYNKPGSFKTTGGATSMDKVQRDQVQGKMVIEDGVLYIKYNGTKYNVQGIRIE